MMMHLEQIIAISSPIVTLVVCLINNWAIIKKSENKQDRLIDIIEIKIDNLSKQVEKHNTVIERTYELEKQVAILKSNKNKED